MAEHSLEISKVVWERYIEKNTNIRRIGQLKQREYFDLPSDLIEWNESEVIEEDYSYGMIKIILNDEIVSKREVSMDYGKFALAYYEINID